MNYQLEVSNVTKSYGDLKANDNVSLNIKDSSTFGSWSGHQYS